MYRLLTIAFLLVPLRGEVIDRVAITVDQQVITELQIDEELRITDFLNQQPISRDIDARRAAADRLIQQLLVRREMNVRHFPAPEAMAINQFADQIRMALPTGINFDASLKRYDLTEEVLRAHLALQLATLQFIDVRFRPDLEISNTDIENYYRREIAKWKTERPGAQPPTLAESRESIRNVLAGQRTDEALETWLAERRRQVNILYLDKTLE